MTSIFNAKARWFTKCVASLLVIIFSFSSVSYSAPGISLPDVPFLPQTSLVLSPEIGAVESVFEPAHVSANTPFVYLVQDAHENIDVQENIREILKKLVQDGVSLVLFEGGSLEFNPAIYQTGQNHDFDEKVWDALFKQGEISGVERFSLSEKVKALGIEDEKIYFDNIAALSGLFKSQDIYQPSLNRFDAALSSIAGRLLSGDLKKLRDINKSFQLGKTDLMHYARRLSRWAHESARMDFSKVDSQRDWPQIYRLLKLAELEKELSSKQKEVTAELAKVSGSSFVWNASEHWRVCGRLRWHFERAIDEMRSRGEDPENYPNLKIWIGFQVLQDEISSKDLFEELERLEKLILNQKAQDAATKNFFALEHDFDLMRKLSAFELSRDELTEIKNRNLHIQTLAADLSALHRIVTGHETEAGLSSDPGLHSFFNQALKTYDLVLRRDQVLSENALRRTHETKAKKVALVVGGFHSSYLDSYLKDKNIRHTLISPAIRDIHHRLNYRERITLVPSSGKMSRADQLPPVIVGSAAGGKIYKTDFLLKKAKTARIFRLAGADKQFLKTSASSLEEEVKVENKTLKEKIGGVVFPEWEKIQAKSLGNKNKRKETPNVKPLKLSLSHLIFIASIVGLGIFFLRSSPKSASPISSAPIVSRNSFFSSSSGVPALETREEVITYLSELAGELSTDIERRQAKEFVALLSDPKIAQIDLSPIAPEQLVGSWTEASILPTENHADGKIKSISYSAGLLRFHPREIARAVLSHEAQHAADHALMRHAEYTVGNEITQMLKDYASVHPEKDLSYDELFRIPQFREKLETYWIYHEEGEYRGLSRAIIGTVQAIDQEGGIDLYLAKRRVIPAEEMFIRAMYEKYKTEYLLPNGQLNEALIKQDHIIDQINSPHAFRDSGVMAAYSEYLRKPKLVTITRQDHVVSVVRGSDAFDFLWKRQDVLQKARRIAGEGRSLGKENFGRNEIKGSSLGERQVTLRFRMKDGDRYILGHRYYLEHTRVHTKSLMVTDDYIFYEIEPANEVKQIFADADIPVEKIRRLMFVFNEDRAALLAEVIYPNKNFLVLIPLTGKFEFQDLSRNVVTAYKHSVDKETEFVPMLMNPEFTDYSLTGYKFKDTVGKKDNWDHLEEVVVTIRTNSAGHATAESLGMLDSGQREAARRGINPKKVLPGLILDEQGAPIGGKVNLTKVKIGIEDKGFGGRLSDAQSLGEDEDDDRQWEDSDDQEEEEAAEYVNQLSVLLHEAVDLHEAGENVKALEKVGEAKKRFAQMLGEIPVDVLMVEAEIHRGMENWDSAIRIFGQVIERIQPWDEESQKTLSDVLWKRLLSYGGKKQFDDEMIADATRLIDLGHAEALRFRAGAYGLGLNRWDLARKDFEDLIATLPKEGHVTASTYVDLSQTYDHLGDFKEEERCLNIARELDSMDPRINVAYAQFLYKRKRYEEALQRIDEAILYSGDEKDSKVHGLRGRILLGLGRMEEARQELNPLISEGVAFLDAAQAIRKKLEAEKLMLLSATASYVVKNKKKKPYSVEELKALMQKFIGKFFVENFIPHIELTPAAEAIPFLSDLIVIYGESAALLEARAEAYSKLKDWDHAVADYRRTLELNPAGKVSVYLSLHNLLMKLDRTQEAEDVLRQANRNMPEEPVILWKLGETLKETEKFTEALATYSQAIELVEHKSEKEMPLKERVGYYNSRARMHMIFGHDDQAEKDFRHILMLDPTAKGIYLDLAHAVKDPAEQIAAIKKYIELAPDDYLGYQILAKLFADRNEFQKALEAANKAIELVERVPNEKKPIRKSVLYELRGDIYSGSALSTKNMDDARLAKRDYEEVLKLMPDYVIAEVKSEQLFRKLESSKNSEDKKSEGSDASSLGHSFKVDYGNSLESVRFVIRASGNSVWTILETYFPGVYDQLLDELISGNQPAAEKILKSLEGNETFKEFMSYLTGDEASLVVTGPVEPKSLILQLSGKRTAAVVYFDDLKWKRSFDQAVAQLKNKEEIERKVYFADLSENDLTPEKFLEQLFEGKCLRFEKGNRTLSRIASDAGIRNARARTVWINNPLVIDQVLARLVAGYGLPLSIDESGNIPKDQKEFYDIIRLSLAAWLSLDPDFLVSKGYVRFANDRYEITESFIQSFLKDALIREQAVKLIASMA